MVNKINTKSFFVGIAALFLISWIYSFVSGADLESSRWVLQKDMNYDGQVTISDTWLMVKWFFSLPGDFLIAMFLGIESIATYLEISYYSFGNWFSTVVSFFIWGGVFVAWALIQNYLEER